MRAVDGTTFTFSTTTTTSAFVLAGGLYFIDVVLGGGGSVALKKLGGDQLTYLSIAGAGSLASTSISVNLGRGTYRVEGPTAGTTWVEIVRIPGD